MLSDLWSKFFLNKFLQNFPDIFTYIHYNVCIILVSFDYFNREIISYLLAICLGIFSLNSPFGASLQDIITFWKSWIMVPY